MERTEHMARPQSRDLLKTEIQTEASHRVHLLRRGVLPPNHHPGFPSGNEASRRMSSTQLTPTSGLQAKAGELVQLESYHSWQVWLTQVLGAGSPHCHFRVKGTHRKHLPLTLHLAGHVIDLVAPPHWASVSPSTNWK